MLRFSSADSAWRATIAACIVGSKTAARRLPAALAVYIATSAFRSNSSACSPRPRDTAIPMLPPTEISCPWIWNGTRSASIIRFATASAPIELDLVRQEHRELVAAQPRRQVVGADAVPDPVRDRGEQPVAGRVAQRVVDDLEVVEVEEEDDRSAGRPAARSSCSSTRSAKRARLAARSAGRGRPGSGAAP